MARGSSVGAVIEFLALGVRWPPQVDSLLHPREGLLAERLALLALAPRCILRRAARRQEGHEYARRFVDMVGPLDQLDLTVFVNPLHSQQTHRLSLHGQSRTARFMVR